MATNNGAKANGTRVRGAEPPNLADVVKKLPIPRQALAVPADGMTPVGLYGIPPREPNTMDRLKEMREGRMEERIAAAQLEEVELETQARKANLVALHAESESKLADAELKRTTTQMQLEELRNSRQSSMSPEMQMLFGLLTEKLNQPAQPAMDPQVAILLEKISDANARLSDTVKDLNSRIIGVEREISKPVEQRSPKEELEANITFIALMKEMVDKLFPPREPAPVAVSGVRQDLELQLIQQKNQLEMERFRFEMDSRRESERAERELRMRELEVQERRTDGLKESFASLLGQLGPITKDFLEQAVARRQEVPIPSNVIPFNAPAAVNGYAPPTVVYHPEAASQVPSAPIASPTPHASPQPSASHTITCPNEWCGGQVIVSEGQEYGTCDRCGEKFAVGWQDNPEPQPTLPITQVEQVYAQSNNGFIADDHEGLGAVRIGGGEAIIG